jgi:hypothetical protein
LTGPSRKRRSSMTRTSPPSTSCWRCPRRREPQRGNC